MGRGPSDSPAGEPSRAAGSFPGMPEAAATSAALFLYSPPGSEPGAFLPAFAIGALLCAAGAGLRAALDLPGFLPRRGASEPFSRRRKAALASNACLLLAALGAGLAWAGVVGAERRVAAAEWSGLPRASVKAFSGTLAADSREARSGAALYDIELSEVESEFARAGAKGRVVLAERGGPRLCAGTRVRVSAGLPAAGEIGFCEPGALSSRGFPSAFDGLRARAREGFVASVSRIGSSGGPLLVALMTGDKSSLPREEEDAFKKAGCAHILALSGQHIGILAALLGFILVPLLGKRASLVLSSAIVLAYLVVTGIQPSILRSVISYLVAAGAWFLARKPRGETVLAWTFLIASALQPGSLSSASFVLSYGATAGIILFQGRIAGFFSKWLPPFLSAALGASLAACAASAPLSIGLFGTFNPACIPISVASEPLVSLMMWLGCAGSLACALLPFPWVGRAFGFLLEAPSRLLRWLVDWGASLPCPALGPGLPRNAACAVLACLLLLLYAWRLHGPPRIRFPEGAQEVHGRPRLRHAEEVRPEFPGLPERAGQDRLAG